MIGHYLVDRYEPGYEVTFSTIFELLPNDVAPVPERSPAAFRYVSNPDVPLIVCSHQQPTSRDQDAPTVLVLRDPLDQLLSLYYLHSYNTPGARFTGTLEDFLSASPFVAALLAWLEDATRFATTTDCLIVTYRSLVRDAATQLEAVLRYFGLKRVKRRDVVTAVERSTFDELRRLELTSQIPGLEYDRTLPDHGRVREGRVGSGREHITGDALSGVHQAFQTLSSNAQALLAVHDVSLT